MGIKRENKFFIKFGKICKMHIDKMQNLGYNDCNLIDGVIDEYVVEGITKEGLVFSQKEANGIYNGLQDTNLTRGNGSWSIVLLNTKINNYFVYLKLT